MKKQKITRILAVLLALVMLAGLTACAGRETSESSADGESSTSEVSVPENDGPLTPYEEPVTITWAVQASPVQQFIDGDTYEDNVWS